MYKELNLFAITGDNTNYGDGVYGGTSTYGTSNDINNVTTQNNTTQTTTATPNDGFSGFMATVGQNYLIPIGLFVLIAAISIYIVLWRKKKKKNSNIDTPFNPYS
jgi:hypothetical protein